MQNKTTILEHHMIVGVLDHSRRIAGRVSGGVANYICPQTIMVRIWVHDSPVAEISDCARGCSLLEGWCWCILWHNVQSSHVVHELPGVGKNQWVSGTGMVLDKTVVVPAPEHGLNEYRVATSSDIGLVDPK